MNANENLAFERGRHTEIKLAIQKLERELEFEQMSIEQHLERMKERKFTLYNNVKTLTENHTDYRYSANGVF